MAAEVTVPTFFIVAPPVALATWWLTRLAVKRIAQPWIYRREAKAREHPRP